MKDPLWKPSPERVKKSNMDQFRRLVEEKTGQTLADYHHLYHWSVENIPDFWGYLWDYLDIRGKERYDSVVDDLQKMPGARWFEGAEINFAENLLRFRDDQVAILSWNEEGRREKVTYKELYSQVARLAKSLQELGIQPGDRVAGFVPNLPESIVAMLAATSLGAIWSSCSPDFGFQGVLDRFGQIEPKVLFACDGYFYKGKKIDVKEKLARIVSEIPSLEKVVVKAYGEENPDLSDFDKTVLYRDFISSQEVQEIPFVYNGFDHPVYIMYSSGTTGLPKCIVQGPGVLLNHLKELVLHTNLTREKKIFYFTTCGWMMWNWLVSTLAVGATAVLYDGNPFYPGPGILWEMAEKEGINVFGTSARYITALDDANFQPGKEFDLSALETILSTGSPLPPEGFEYTYREIKEDLQLSSISGGTDLNGCFALGCPTLPVYSGELQCRGLGMKVEVFDQEGKAVVEEKGELVCTAPFPSMPLKFWKDPGDKRYHNAYFDVYPGVWRHGDFAKITAREGMIIYGRSDATLNPGGVRIGTAEIYRVVEEFDSIEDSVVVGQSVDDTERVILFLKMKDGEEVTDELREKVKSEIRQKASPRHVPALIFPAPDIPYTINMKKVEIAVRKAIEGEDIKNKDALQNPECLEYYKNIPELSS